MIERIDEPRQFPSMQADPTDKPGLAAPFRSNRPAEPCHARPCQQTSRFLPLLAKPGPPLPSDPPDPTLPLQATPSDWPNPPDPVPAKRRTSSFRSRAESCHAKRRTRPDRVQPGLSLPRQGTIPAEPLPSQLTHTKRRVQPCCARPLPFVPSDEPSPAKPRPSAPLCPRVSTKGESYDQRSENRPVRCR